MAKTKTPKAKANPHFISAEATGPDDVGNLTVTFKIGGLGDATTTTVTATANAVAMYACRNRDGHIPGDPKKAETVGPVSASDDFTSGKNGQLVGSLVLVPPEPSLECPRGQEFVVLSIVYSNVRVSEPDAGQEDIPGLFSL